MWKWKEEEKPAPSAPVAPSPALSSAAGHNTPKEVRPVETPKSMETFRADVAHIGKSVIVKGELSGSEDLYLDGEVEGTIELRGHNLTIGPNGRIRANVHAREIIIHGRLDGNLQASERVELRKSAVVAGDITTQRIAIEDGAFFKGGIDIQRETAKSDARRETVAAAAIGASAPPTTGQVSPDAKK
jgi:cytoskeletal protein CcmA (bactofilin family)